MRARHLELERDKADAHTPRRQSSHTTTHEEYEAIGKKIYMAGSQRMWWQPLQAPDHVPSGAPRDTVAAKDVLIVEDESYLCELIADVLEAEGHRTDKAANGREALDKLKKYTPDLIILDLMMPIMDGWEVMRALRADPDLANIPVVIITAIYDLKRTQQETGAKAVLTKPFDIDQLAEVVKIYAA